MCRKATFLLWCFMIASCDDHTVFSSYMSLHDPWGKNEKKHFVFQGSDTIHPHHIFFMVSNDETYKFSNLFLIATLHLPTGETVTDTLEYLMAEPNGKWLGKGFTALKQSKLWYKEDFIFTTSEPYNLFIEHAMRENGTVGGISQLQGIKELGIIIEKNKE